MDITLSNFHDSFLTVHRLSVCKTFIMFKLNSSSNSLNRLGVLKTALDMIFEGKHTQNSCSRHANSSIQTVKVGISQKHYFLGIHCFEKKEERSALCKNGEFS